jgi:large subunit ribosomal protein L23
MKEMNSYQIIIKPLVTEKAVGQEAERKYWFAVDTRATKTQIRHAIEQIYQVHVRQVRTLRVGGKQRRIRFKMFELPEWKKAAVTLAPDERIDII